MNAPQITITLIEFRTAHFFQIHLTISSDLSGKKIKFSSIVSTNEQTQERKHGLRLFIYQNKQFFPQVISLNYFLLKSLKIFK